MVAGPNPNALLAAALANTVKFEKGGTAGVGLLVVSLLCATPGMKVGKKKENK